MNPGLRQHPRGQLLHHFQSLEKVGKFERGSTESNNADSRKAKRETGSQEDSLNHNCSLVLRTFPKGPEPQVNRNLGCFLSVDMEKMNSGSLRSTRPLVKRRATPDFDFLEFKENDEEFAHLQKIQLCDLTTIGFMNIKEFPGRDTFIASWSPKSGKEQHTSASKHSDFLKISLADLSFGDASYIKDAKKEASLLHLYVTRTYVRCRGSLENPSKFFG